LADLPTQMAAAAGVVCWTNGQRGYIAKRGAPACAAAHKTPTTPAPECTGQSPGTFGAQPGGISGTMEVPINNAQSKQKYACLALIGASWVLSLFLPSMGLQSAYVFLLSPFIASSLQCLTLSCLVYLATLRWTMQASNVIYHTVIQPIWIYICFALVYSPINDKADHATAWGDTAKWCGLSLSFWLMPALFVRARFGARAMYLLSIGGFSVALLVMWLSNKTEWPPALLTMSLLSPMTSMILGTRVLHMHKKRARELSGSCIRCGYCLAKLQGLVCPECGTSRAR
jgi:hypothetical protein